ncbi:MAG: GGL domain-containing protein [Linnemannia gamsii]|nr:MAG: GGL domain-containing protein [Linnemannia gamsii]
MSASPTASSPMTTSMNAFNNGNIQRSPSLSSGKGGNHSGSASSATTANSSTLTANGSGTTMASSVNGGSVVSGLGSGVLSSGVSDVKLKRFLEHNQRLQEQLEMRRISVSEASESLIKFVMGTKDLLIPTIWGNPPLDPFSKQATGCCTIS